MLTRTFFGVERIVRNVTYFITSIRKQTQYNIVNKIGGIYKKYGRPLNSWPAEKNIFCNFSFMPIHKLS